MFALLSSVALYAYSPPDSLKQSLSLIHDQEINAITFSRLAFYYLEGEEVETDSALYYANRGLNLSENIDYSYGIAKNASVLGDCYILLDSLERAKQFYSIAINEFEKTEDLDISVYPKVLLVLGNIYAIQNNFPKALNAYQKSMDISLKEGLNETTAHLYNNIGYIYMQVDNYEKALPNMEKASQLFSELGSTISVANAFLNIALMHMRDKNYTMALEYLDKTLKLVDKLESKHNIAEANRKIGLIKIEQGKYLDAKIYLNKAYELIYSENFTPETPRSIVESRILYDLAVLSSHLKEYTVSINYAKSSLKLAIPNQHLKIIGDNYYVLANVYEKLNKIDSAYTYFKLYEEYKERSTNESNIKRITQLQLEYDFAKKISEQKYLQSIKDEKQQRLENIYRFIIALVILVAIISFLLYANQKNKTKRSILKRENLELERENLSHKLDLKNSELEYKNKELTTNILYLTKKVGMINSIAKELQNSKFEFEGDNRDTIENIIRQLEQTSSEDTWKEFEIRFMDVHLEFYDNLNKVLPDLTPNEKKLCAFLKLNMSTKDISAITHQSVKSITMARYRLRQKLNLQRDDNLISYLSKL